MSLLPPPQIQFHSAPHPSSDVAVHFKWVVDMALVLNGGWIRSPNDDDDAMVFVKARATEDRDRDRDSVLTKYLC